MFQPTVDGNQAITSGYGKSPIIYGGFIHPRWLAGFLRISSYMFLYVFFVFPPVVVYLYDFPNIFVCRLPRHPITGKVERGKLEELKNPEPCWGVSG